MTSPFKDALGRQQGTGFAAQILRASLRAGDAKFFPSVDRRLVVNIAGGNVSPYDSARITMAVIDATAMFGRYISNPQSQATSTHPSQREKVGLVALGSAGNSLHFGFPNGVGGNEEALFHDHIPSLAEVAARALVETLPQNDEDDLALDSVLSLPVTQRRAVQHLVNAVEDTERSIGMTVSSADGSGISSRLSKVQAGVLKSSLKESQIIRRTIIEQGVLDGMRTRRRIFYLERVSGSDISGSVADDVLSKLPKYLGSLVTVTLEESVALKASGVKGRPTYRLTDIAKSTSLFD